MVIILTFNGRGGLDYEGIRYGAITCKASADLVSSFKNNGRDAVVGKAVTLVGHETVGFGSAGDPLFGKVNQYEEDGHVTVQDAGYTAFEVVSSGSGLGVGSSDYGKSVVVSNGAVMTSTGAVGTSKVISLNATDKSVMVLIS